MAFVVLDFETFSACDLKECGSWRYAEDVTTEVLCLAWETNEGVRDLWHPGLPPPQALFDLIAAGAHLVAHNVAFEKGIWRKIMEPVYGWPAVPNSQWWDTMAVCAMLCLPLALNRVLDVLKIGVEKDKEGSRLTIGLSKLATRGKRKGYYPERTPEVLERVYTYCLSDIEGQVALLKRVGWLPPGEAAIFQHNQRVNERGIRLDLPLIRSMQKVVDDATAPLAVRFHEITGLNFTQNTKVLVWVNAQGVNTASLDKEHMADLLGKDIDEDPDEYMSEERVQISEIPLHVREALEIKQLIGSSSIKKLKRMLSVVCADGRARGLLQYHGTGPGRQTARLFQPHNFPKGSIKGSDGEAPRPEPLVEVLRTGDAGLVERVYGPPVEVVVGALRHCMIPEDDRTYVAGDYSGIQARLVLALAGQHDKTAMMAAGQDVYIDMAQQIFERPIDKKKDPWERSIGKNTVLGLGFYMGAKTFQSKYAKDHPLEFSETVVKTYREKWAPKVPAVWHALGDAALYAVHDKRVTEAYGIEFRMQDQWLTMRLPSGRLLWYFNPVPCRKHMPWSTEERPDIRDAWTYQVTKGGKWLTVDAHGGKTTENAVMGMERDIMTTAQRKLEAAGFPICLEVHDENVCEPLTAHADATVMKQIMEDVDQWVLDMQVPVQVDVWGPERRYRK